MFALDLGNHTSVLAVVDGGGADTVPNAIGSRATPTVVSYGAQQRYLGEDAASQRVTNSANTVEGLPSLLGRRAAGGGGGADPATTELGGDGVRVSYGGKELTLANEAVVGAYMAGMVQLARNVHPVPGQEPALVLAVPSYYTAVQRHALAHAGTIAGARIAQLCDETIATALFYAHERLADAAQTSRSQAVLFVDAGHCHTTAFVVHYDHASGTLRVVDSETILVGGRDLVALLAQKFERDVQEQKGVQITTRRAKLRLLAEAEKAKKVLSANSSWSTLMEELQEGLDFEAKASRDEFTELCDAAGLLARLGEGVTALLLRVLTSGAMHAVPIGAVELFGGCARVPAVSSAIIGAVSAIEGLGGLGEGKSSLNGAESVARGAALYGASLQPGGHGRLMRVQHCASRAMSLSLDVLTAAGGSEPPQPADGDGGGQDDPMDTAEGDGEAASDGNAANDADCSMFADDSQLLDLPSVPTESSPDTVVLPSVPTGGDRIVLGVSRGQPLPYVFGATDALAVDPATCAQRLARVALSIEEDGDCARPAADGRASALTVMLYSLELTSSGEAAVAAASSGEGEGGNWPLQLALVGNDGTMKVLQPASRGGEPLLRLSPLAPSSLPADQQQPLLSAAQLEALVEQERSMLSADLEVGKAMEAHDQLERCATFNPRYSILYLVRHAVCTT